MTETAPRVNRIKVSAKVPGMLNEYMMHMAEYDKICWGIGPAPHEIMHAAGVGGLFLENMSARIAASQEQARYIEIAEAAGLGTDGCSYSKINIGLSLMMLNGMEDQIPPRFRLPKPDMVAVVNSCPTMLQWANSLVELFDVPLFVADAPFFYDPTQWRRNVDYMKKQLGEFVAFLEKVTGRPFDWENLKHTVEIVKRMSAERRRIAQLCKTKPAPASFIDCATSMGPALSIRTEEAVDLYRDFADEMLERKKKGTGVLDEEKYRIMWRGNFPWYRMGWISRLMAKHKAVIVSGVYGYMAFGDFAREQMPPDGIDLDDPLATIAAESAWGGGYTQTFDWKWQHEFREYIDGYDIDAVIIHSPFTCRPWALTAYDMAAWVEKEYGIPVLVLDSDHTDARYFQDAQVENRIQALLETVDARREAR